MNNCALRIFWSFTWRSLLVLVPVKLALRYFWSFVWVWFRVPSWRDRAAT